MQCESWKQGRRPSSALIDAIKLSLSLAAELRTRLVLLTDESDVMCLVIAEDEQVGFNTAPTEDVPIRAAIATMLREAYIGRQQWDLWNQHHPFSLRPGSPLRR